MHAAPKNESDCGVTTMCTVPAPAHHAEMPLWSVELVLFVSLVLVAAVGYRLLLAWHRPTS
jgi:hypothetical protein